MARQISVSDEVYSMLSRMKDSKSFSETIKQAIGEKVETGDTELMKFAGILKNERKKLKMLQQTIAKEREKH